MKKVEIFHSPIFGDVLVTVDESGKVFFKANDVAKALGYSKPANAVTQYCRCVTVLMTHDSLGRLQPTKFIAESDLYRLVMRSKLPKAEEFQTWVCEEVIPSIMHNGGYIATRNDDTPEMIMARALNVANHIIAEHEKKITRLEEQVGELEEQTAYSRLIESAPGDVNINQIALDYGWSAIVMNRKLHELRIQYYQGGQWILYAKYKGNGYVNSETIICDDGKARIHTKWTQRGRRFIYNELRKELILPLCERY